MSTDVRELSDTELQELFESEKKCDCYRYTSEPVYQVTWKCDKPAEWLTVCKACGSLGFSCVACYSLVFESPSIMFECKDCKIRSMDIQSILRVVGRV